MKYMGSKRWMLGNGLGDLLNDKGKSCKRFIDLFAGSGAVGAYVATRHDVPCYAYDIQSFSVVLSDAILSRSEALDGKLIWVAWKSRACARLGYVLKEVPQQGKSFTKEYVLRCRDWSEVRRGKVVTSSYGGHYFSPEQALWIDALRSSLPENAAERQAALASLIQAASQCAASPGHTAQPFQPTKTAKEYIKDAWNRDLLQRTEDALFSICERHAKSPGGAYLSDANEAVKELKEGDLVFIDPPYSGVHYSRFYHVLETIARGACSGVTGVGRYPKSEERPISKYSIGSKAPAALDELLERVSKSGATGILTFPSHDCSNGLSGESVRETAKKYFRVTEKIVESKFSSLGGNNKKSQKGNVRHARVHAKELILYLEKKG